MSQSDWVWGVDVAVHKLAFAFASLDGPVQTETLITRNDRLDGQRLGLIDRQARIYARQAAHRWPPVCVWVEQPSGRFPKPQLAYTAGVVQAALAETLACPVLTITSGDWKKRTVGAGNATKAQVAAWVGARALVDGQDEADAYCIAVAGAQRVVIPERAA